jgi:hypothetical protein
MSREAIRNTALKNGTVGASVVTIGSAPFDFSAELLANAAQVTICVNTNGIVITWDGATDPTATKGLPIAAGVSLTLPGKTNISRLRMIKSGASDATVTLLLEG